MLLSERKAEFLVKKRAAAEVLEDVTNFCVAIESTAQQWAYKDFNVINYDESVKKDGMLLHEGYIALQSESHPVEFRKVELLNLEPYADDAGALQRVLQRLKLR